MRFMLILLIWVVIIGSVILYIETREETAPGVISESQPEPKTYNIELLASFPIEEDSFRKNDEISRQPAITVLLNGKSVFNKAANLSGSMHFYYKRQLQFSDKKNEIYLEAHAPISYIGQNLALRLRILTGNTVIYEKTFWSDGDNSIYGTCIYEVKGDE